MYIEISEEYAVMVADDVGHLSAKFAIHTWGLTMQLVNESQN